MHKREMWDMIKMSCIHLLTGILKGSVEGMRLRQSIFGGKKNVCVVYKSKRMQSPQIQEPQ